MWSETWCDPILPGLLFGSCINFLKVFVPVHGTQDDYVRKKLFIKQERDGLL